MAPRRVVTHDSAGPRAVHSLNGMIYIVTGKVDVASESEGSYVARALRLCDDDALDAESGTKLWALVGEGLGGWRVVGEEEERE